MITETSTIKKASTGYLLGYILGPIAVVLVISILGSLFLGNAGAMLGTASMIAAILWWAVLGNSVYQNEKKKKLKELEESGFTPNHTFNGDGCCVVVDLNTNKVALLFRWNPSEIYVRPAAALSRVHSEDGRSGSGVMEGSSCVRFVFWVDGIRVRVNTFTSNRRWSMNSKEIQTGIDKADRMVESLVSAGAKAGK